MPVGRWWSASHLPRPDLKSAATMFSSEARLYPCYQITRYGYGKTLIVLTGMAPPDEVENDEDDLDASPMPVAGERAGAESSGQVHRRRRRR